MSVNIRAWFLKDDRDPANAATFAYLKTVGLPCSKASGRGPDALNAQEPETESFVFELHALPEVMRALRNSDYPDGGEWQIHYLSAVAVTFYVPRPRRAAAGGWYITVPAANIKAIYPADNGLLAAAGIKLGVRRRHGSRRARRREHGVSHGRRRWQRNTRRDKQSQASAALPSAAVLAAPPPSQLQSGAPRG